METGEVDMFSALETAIVWVLVQQAAPSCQVVSRAKVTLGGLALAAGVKLVRRDEVMTMNPFTLTSHFHNGVYRSPHLLWGVFLGTLLRFKLPWSISSKDLDMTRMIAGGNKTHIPEGDANYAWRSSFRRQPGTCQDTPYKNVLSSVCSVLHRADGYCLTHLRQLLPRLYIH